MKKSIKEKIMQLKILKEAQKKSVPDKDYPINSSIEVKDQNEL